MGASSPTLTSSTASWCVLTLHHYLDGTCRTGCTFERAELLYKLRRAGGRCAALRSAAGAGRRCRAVHELRAGTREPRLVCLLDDVALHVRVAAEAESAAATTPRAARAAHRQQGKWHATYNMRMASTYGKVHAVPNSTWSSICDLIRWAHVLFDHWIGN